ncbi:MAG: FMN-binding protein [Spirochaetia bacterium]|jgi:electron transport complex protein RnfG|nr:FMN-binding protein [Spirochaetia bacterium]
MKEVMKIGGKLAAICAIAAIALGIVNAITEPIIIAARAEKVRLALIELSVGLEIGELNEVNNEGAILGYYPLSSLENIKAYIVNIIGSGYAGDMNLLTAISLEGEVLSVVLMKHTETPGLGKEAENASYMEKFIGKGNGSIIPSSKSHLDPKEADSIAGASITFIGIGKALNEAADFVGQLGGM